MVYLVTAVVSGRRTLEIFSSEEKAKNSVLGRKPGATMRKMNPIDGYRCVARHEELHGC